MTTLVILAMTCGHVLAQPTYMAARYAMHNYSPRPVHVSAAVS